MGERQATEKFKMGLLISHFKKNINFKSVNEMTWVEKRKGGGVSVKPPTPTSKKKNDTSTPVPLHR